MRELEELGDAMSIGEYDNSTVYSIMGRVEAYVDTSTGVMSVVRFVHGASSCENMPLPDICWPLSTEHMLHDIQACGFEEGC